jgi:hypothetical protein
MLILEMHGRGVNARTVVQLVTMPAIPSLTLSDGPP